MRLAVDFDDTITRDPVLWASFIRTAVQRGHDVRIVTFRSTNWANDDIAEFRHNLGVTCPVIFTNGIPKRACCWQDHGWIVDVWCDDMPEIIVGDYVPGMYLAAASQNEEKDAE